MSTRASKPGRRYALEDATDDLIAEASTTELGRDGSATACTTTPGEANVLIEPMTS
jgi:hypothetical protein